MIGMIVFWIMPRMPQGFPVSKPGIGQPEHLPSLERSSDHKIDRDQQQEQQAELDPLLHFHD